MKIKTLVLAALVMVAFTVHAQPKKGKKGKQKVSKEYKAEMKAFYQNEVYPILKEKHDEFDASLNAEDLTKLQNLRSENKAVQEQMKALKKEMRAERKNSDDKEATNPDSYRGKYGEKIKALRQNQRSSMGKLRPIIENYQELVKSTIADITALKEEWKEQRQAIATKHGVEHQQGKKSGKGKGKRKRKAEGTEENSNRERGERRKGKKGKGQRGEGRKGMHAAAKFLLWDGSLKSIADIDENAAKAMKTKPEVEQNFPNPATNSTRIKFKLPKDAENVRLVVTNIDGKVMDEQTFKQLAAGKHQVDLNVANWSKGVYFYTISSEGFKKTKKMSIQ